jgi:hypothetical protein
MGAEASASTLKRAPVKWYDGPFPGLKAGARRNPLKGVF